MKVLRRIIASRIALSLALLLCLGAASIPAQAETVSALLQLSPANEVPPITGLTATGGFVVTVDIQRNSAGDITGGRVNFLGAVAFPGAITITGLHIHEGAATVNGAVKLDSGISGSNPLMLANGAGIISREAILAASEPDAAAFFKRFIANPAGFYLNLHTTVNAGGAIRAQLTKLVEVIAQTFAMSGAQEVPPITNAEAAATGVGTVTLYPVRNAQGQVTGGSLNLAVNYDFPAAATFTGFHIHEGAAGVNAGVVFNTQLNATNNIVSPTGKGTYGFTVNTTTAANVASFARLVANPTGFYLNLHTMLNGGGAVRGQLGAASTLALPPVIGQASTLYLASGGAATTVNLLVAGIDLTSTVLLNGAPATFNLDIATGQVVVNIPADARANPGTIALQVRNGAGLRSTPVFIVVGAGNGAAAAVTDAAAFNPSVTPEGIAAVFGTNMATATAATTVNPLPAAIAGTSVYVNGVFAPLFFVSPGQINFQMPENTLAGPASVIVRAPDGSVSRATVNVVNTAGALFTRLSNGRGAPAAVASNDNGATFTIGMSNADGTPVEVQAGNVLQLFGTGFRFTSQAVRAAAAGVDMTPSFAGPQGSLIGLDQINLTLPAAMAGKGETDLVFTVDGKAANAVRIRVR